MAERSHRPIDLVNPSHIPDSDLPELVKLFLEGQYEKILESSDIAMCLFAQLHKNEDKPPTIFGDFIKQNVEQAIAQHQEGDGELRALSILIVAASCLQLFCQNNWLGPPTEKSPLQFCHECFRNKAADIETEAINDLSVDGEPVYTLARHLIYLYMAKIIFLECRTCFPHIQSWDWWLMRTLVIQQALLPERSPSLMSTVMEIIDDLSKKEPLMTDDKNKDIQIMFHIEACHACHTYFEYKRAADHSETARKIAGIKVGLGGALGKRTKFQQENKAQLVLQVEREGNTEEAAHTHKKFPTPKNLQLDDDTVLNNVKFSDDTVEDSSDLSPIEQALVMALMESYRRSQAQERLTEEEVLTYISYILSHANNWSVAVVALNLRSKLEKNSRRRVERSMMQLEELAKTAVTQNAATDIAGRIPLFFSSHAPSIWLLQKDLASLLLSLGVTGQALDIYEKLEMWEDVITCYQKLGKREKAETVIRERLAIKETPTLLCFLGDVTRDLEHYQRAWEMSGHKSARAMRCMAYVYFQERKYEDALKCFATSLEINSLQVPVWFTYGCAAMACEKYEIGVKAFKRCVSIDYDNFEAWSNLATCYVRLKQKEKAYATLQDALKCNFENWRLWENNMIIGTDCGQFEEVIRSYHRLLDLKDKWTDAEVLKILTRAVTENILDADGNPAEHLDKKLLELFGRITSKVTADGEIWASYAKLSNTKVANREADSEKAFQHLQKAYRCFTQKSGWEKDVDTCKKVADQAQQLAKLHVEVSEGKPQQESILLLSGAKLTLRGALAKIQKQHTDPISGDVPPDVGEICQQMDSTIFDIVSRIDALKGE